MKSWTFGTNYVERRGVIYLVDQPWYLALADSFIDGFVAWLCYSSWLSSVPLPNWLPRARDRQYGDDTLYTLREYWGDVGGVLSTYVHNPLYQWLFTYRQKYEISIAVGYDTLRAALETTHPSAFTHDDDMQRWSAQHREAEKAV